MGVWTAWLLVGCTPDPTTGDSSSDTVGGGTESGITDSGLSTSPTADLLVTVEDTTYGLTLTGPPTLADRDGLSLLAVEASLDEPNVDIAFGVYNDQPLLPGDFLLGVWGGPTEQTRITLVVVDGVTVHTFRTSDFGVSEGALTIAVLDREKGLVSLAFAGELDHAVNGGAIDGTVPVTGVLTTTSLALER